MFITLEEAEELAKHLNRDPLFEQRKAMKTLQGEIENKIKQSRSGSITIKVASKKEKREFVFKEIVEVRQFSRRDLQGNVDETVSRDPKTDFALINKYTEPSGYISHKATGAKNMLQYGGVSELAGIEIKEHPETKGFVQDLAKYADDMFYSSFHRRVYSDDLKQLSLYGQDFLKGEFGLNSVHIIGKGHPSLLPLPYGEDTYLLKFGDFTWLAGETYGLRGDYEARFVAFRTSKAERSVQAENIKIPGMRAGIFPAIISNTRNSLMI